MTRVFLAVLVLVAAGAGVAGWLLSRQKPPKPKTPSFAVSVARASSLDANEGELAEPLDRELSQVVGVERLRTRVTAKAVEIEVWTATPDVDLRPALEKAKLAEIPALRPLRPGSVTYWLIQEPKPMSELRVWAERSLVPELQREVGVRSVELCGVEAVKPTVRIDMARLAATQVSPHDVLRALQVGALPLEELGRLPLKANVRLSDVALLELAPPPPSCLAWTQGRGAILMTARHEPDATPHASGGTPVGAVSTVKLALPPGLRPDHLPDFGELAPLAMSLELPSTATLYFSPPLTVAARDQALIALAKVPDVSLLHVDGMRRVTLVFTGPDREALSRVATALVRQLRATPGVRFVVPPPAEVPLLDAKVDRARAAELGIAHADATELLELALSGIERTGVRVALTELAEPEHLAALPIGDRRLGDVVRLEQRAEPQELLRIDRQPALEVTAFGIDAKGVPMPALPAGVMLEIREEL